MNYRHGLHLKEKVLIITCAATTTTTTKSYPTKWSRFYKHMWL